MVFMGKIKVLHQVLDPSGIGGVSTEFRALQNSELSESSVLNSYKRGIFSSREDFCVCLGASSADPPNFCSFAYSFNNIVSIISCQMLKAADVQGAFLDTILVHRGRLLPHLSFRTVIPKPFHVRNDLRY